MAGTGYKGSRINDVDQFLKGDGLDSGAREGPSGSTSAIATM